MHNTEQAVVPLRYCSLAFYLNGHALVCALTLVLLVHKTICCIHLFRSTFTDKVWPTETLNLRTFSWILMVRYMVLKIHQVTKIAAIFTRIIFGSCVLKISVVECWSIPLIDTLHRNLINTLVDTQSTLNQHLGWQLDESQLTFVDKPLSVNQWLIFDWDVDRVLIDCWLRCQSSVDQG